MTNSAAFLIATLVFAGLGWWWLAAFAFIAFLAVVR
jgi:hypothetical protein